MPSPAAHALPQSPALPPIAQGLMGLALVVARWEMRLRTRKALEKLDDHLLQDIGLDRARAEAEWQKPFWWK